MYCVKPHEKRKKRGRKERKERKREEGVIIISKRILNTYN
jgi:hypothetical protein